VAPAAAEQPIRYAALGEQSMSRFEFNTVLVSIVLAFAISELLTAWGRLIRHRARVRSVGIFVLASSWVLAAMVGHWFGFWAYREAPFDQYIQTVLVLLPSLVIALVCYIWVPDIPSQGEFDTEQHYFESARWTLSLIALFLVLGATADWLVPNVEFGVSAWQLLPWAGALLACAFSRSRPVHFAIFAASWVALLAPISSFSY
jgi:hypothetical protein